MISAKNASITPNVCARDVAVVTASSIMRAQIWLRYVHDAVIVFKLNGP